MRIQKATIQRFKSFHQPIELDFLNEDYDEALRRYLIIGDNAAGKTTLLQALALPLAMASGFVRTIEDFRWYGFMPERYLVGGSPRIELRVVFSEDELSATHEVAQRWNEQRSETEQQQHEFMEPGTNPEVTLLLDGHQLRVIPKNPKKPLNELYQFRGRFYAAQLVNRYGDQGARDLFKRLPGVFWFDQYRNTLMFPSETNASNGGEHSRELRYTSGFQEIRDNLTAWFFAKGAGKQYRTDYASELSDRFSAVFPGRALSRGDFLGENPTPADYRFYLTDAAGREYELMEMSGGEQAVFPILFRLVREHVANSVVLIDEVDLNLHPPAAQSLVSVLGKIAPQSQFFLTTHSTAVSTLFQPYEVKRLEGGRLCL